MVSTNLDLANTVFLNLGINMISNLESSIKNGDLAAISFNHIIHTTRRRLLAQNDWNFALKTIDVVLEYDDNLQLYYFNLPTDLLKFQNIITNHIKLKHEYGTKFYVTNHSNNTSCKIEYVFDEVNLDAWSDTLIDVLVAALSARLAPTLKPGIEISEYFIQSADKKMSHEALRKEERKSKISYGHPRGNIFKIGGSAWY